LKKNWQAGEWLSAPLHTHHSLNDFLALSVFEGHHEEKGEVRTHCHRISL
jgi:hypothetical protein